MDPIVIQNYDPVWPRAFDKIRSKIETVLEIPSIIIEHVGSTAVPGLAAKPIIDLDVLLHSADELPHVIERLASIGYQHQGNLGIVDREAFRTPPDEFPHHLYVCLPGASEFKRHLAFRDYLRAHPDELKAYADLKWKLAVQFRDDRAAYSQAKGAFVDEILRKASV